MNIYSYIKECEKNKKFKEKYYSTGNRALSLFSTYYSTNVRKNDTVINYINKMEKFIGVERERWPKNKNNQEDAKQYIVPLMSSEMIYIKEKGIYYYTQKAELLKKVSYMSLSKEEIKIISTIFTSNYNRLGKKSIAEEVDFFIEILKKNDYDLMKLKSLIIDTINSKEKYFFLTNRLYLIMTFYQEGIEGGDNLLKFIIDSSEEEINDINKRIEEELKNKNYTSGLAKRFEQSGKLSPQTFKDQVKMLNTIIEIKKGGSYDDILMNVLQYYNIDQTKVKNILISEDYKNVILKVFEDVNNNLDFVKGTESKIESDITTKSGKMNDEAIFESSKKQVLENYGYDCFLSKLRGCKKLYFTSPLTNKNYLEIHHFLPRKYKNYIEGGVEFFENYIPLCPSCHRMIHHATDIERRTILNYILNENKVVKEKVDSISLEKSTLENDTIEVLYDFK